ncbi:9-O-acetylesterase [Hymenobacter sp. HDW8]|nr:9-O-acetylesterase [Hymenobacter sp. HDW8]
MRLIKYPLLLLTLLTQLSAQATVRVPKLVGDHMVLQRDKPLQLWGWADAGEAVTVSFRGKSYPAKTGGPGNKWTVTLPAQPTGGPYEMSIKGSNTIQIRDILLGDVWLASGQSNMEWPLQQNVVNFKQEIAQANFPRIRLLNVQDATAAAPQADFKSEGWKVCSPETVGGFSAVAYFFGRDLHQQYKVPIGLIASEWGGTPAEAWTSGQTLRNFPEFAPQVAALESSTGPARQQADYQAALAAWKKSPASQDRGLIPGQTSWTDPAYTPTSWPTMQLPGLWEDQPEHPELRGFDGIIWLRREVTLPATVAGQPLTLSLAQIDDRDSTWFNGVLVGSTNGYTQPRGYTVPGTAVRAGRNVIAVRVVDTGGGGGIWGKPEELYLKTTTQTIPLNGPWQYQPAYDPASVPKNPFPGGTQNQPTMLYNAMIAPLVPYALKGVIWYQGESNAERAYQYRALFPALIQDWRTQFGQKDLPFLYVQLASFGPQQDQPADYAWAELREAQLMTLAQPKTGMAVALDLGNPNDIHPLNKQDVGHRLALEARRVAYGDKAVVSSGPAYKSMKVEGNRVRLQFDNMGSGLILKDNSGPYLKGFAIAGTDRKFVWAQGKLEGNSLVLYSDQVAKPVAVRYAWGNSPFVNLYNKENLPASSFRTDTWPGVTEGKK